jgi:hypothetical protein
VQGDVARGDPAHVLDGRLKAQDLLDRSFDGRRIPREPGALLRVLREHQ